MKPRTVTKSQAIGYLAESSQCLANAKQALADAAYLLNKAGAVQMAAECTRVHSDADDIQKEARKARQNLEGIVGV